MSALPPKADIPESDWHVRFVPKADIAHRHLDITAADWNVFRTHLGVTIDSLSLADRERQEIITFAEGLRGEIVTDAQY